MPPPERVFEQKEIPLELTIACGQCGKVVLSNQVVKPAYAFRVDYSLLTSQLNDYPDFSQNAQAACDRHEQEILNLSHEEFLKHGTIQEWKWTWGGVPISTG